MNEFEQWWAEEIRASVNEWSTSTERAEQDKQFIIGPSAIGYCLSGETEVPTRSGVVPIASLAGTTAELLVPTRSRGGLGAVAAWQPVEVKDFGEQSLMKVTLGRPGGATKVVYATANHRWFATRRSENSHYSVVRTSDLEVGHRLKQARATTSARMRILPGAAVAGFIHGDGSIRHSDSEVTIYQRGNKVDSDIVPLLRGMAGSEKAVRDGIRYRGFPKSWKSIPDFSHETSAYALSWLAGYFAADGSVDHNGGCSIQSSNRASIEAARFAALLAGVSTNPIITAVVTGGLGLAADEERTVHRISLHRRSVPGWFFLNAHHHERVARANEGRDPASTAWSVRSVERTNRIERVYCAVVPGVEAFVLTEGLVTHNCSERLRRQLDRQQATDPVDWNKAFIGTWLGEGLEQAILKRHPRLLIQSEFWIDLQGDRYTYRIPAHSDVIDPDSGLVLDYKAKDGLMYVRRQDTADQGYQFQRHLYGLGAWQSGLFGDIPLSEVKVGNAYYDRSGREPLPHVQIEPYSDEVVRQAVWWLDEVVESFLAKEEATKEPPRVVCETTCGFFTKCRAYDTDVEGLIQDEKHRMALDMYVEGGDLERTGKKMKQEAQVILKGVEGNTSDYTLRWTLVNGGPVSYDRESYLRMDVRKRRK